MGGVWPTSWLVGEGSRSRGHEGPAGEERAEVATVVGAGAPLVPAGRCHPRALGRVDQLEVQGLVLAAMLLQIGRGYVGGWD